MPCENRKTQACLIKSYNRVKKFSCSLLQLQSYPADNRERESKLIESTQQTKILFLALEIIK